MNKKTKKCFILGLSSFFSPLFCPQELKRTFSFCEKRPEKRPKDLEPLKENHVIIKNENHVIIKNFVYTKSFLAGLFDKNYLESFFQGQGKKDFPFWIKNQYLVRLIPQENHFALIFAWTKDKNNCIKINRNFPEPYKNKEFSTQNKIAIFEAFHLLENLAIGFESHNSEILMWCLKKLGYTIEFKIGIKTIFTNNPATTRNFEHVANTLLKKCIE